MACYCFTMRGTSNPTLQELFLSSKGQPQTIDGRTVIQMDRIALSGKVQVFVSFEGNNPFEENAAVLAISKPGAIFLTTGKPVHALAIWDENGLPRHVDHIVEPRGEVLCVYNKYRTRHSEKFVTEDSFTGNAGMIVTSVAPNRRRYECSNGPGAFSPTDIIFEVSWTNLDLN